MFLIKVQQSYFNRITLSCVIADKNFYLNLLATYQIFLGVAIKALPASLKVLTFPFCWIRLSHNGKFYILGKKVPLIAFREVLTRILPAACIQLHNFDLFEKTQLKRTRIICQASLFLPKMSQNCWTPFPCTFMGNAGDGEKSYSTAKNLLISPKRKIPLID